MVLYKHRANQITDPFEYKALEIDVKFSNGEVVLGHDVDEITCSLIDYLANCNTETELAINIKQSGMASVLTDILPKYPLKSYFYFDHALPDLLLYLQIDPEHTAFRWSEYACENHNFSKAGWIWVDFFHYHESNDKLMYFNKKFVVASPELHKSDYRYKNLTQHAYGLCTDDL